MKPQIMKQRRLKSKKNALIDVIYDKLNVLRTRAYEENQTDWFHRMNELCIWVGEQLEFKTWIEEEEEITTREEYYRKFGGYISTPYGTIPEWFRNLK